MIGSKFVVEPEFIQQLLSALTKHGYRLIGPTVREAAVVYDEIASVTDLPVGFRDTQNGGTYRLIQRDDRAYFGFTTAANSWKTFLLRPRERMWAANRHGFQIERNTMKARRYALIGVRACDLKAIAIQDRILLDKYVDHAYLTRREQVLIVSVSCGRPGGTCFCVSMSTGPKAASGFDLDLTEVLDDGCHYFVLEIGSERGAEIVEDLPHRQATLEELRAAERVVATAAAHMGRNLDASDIKELLYRNYEHPRWDDVAKRCLTCGNCTLVCPTCFCTTVEDVTDLDGGVAERVRRWDSCFTLDFSYIHGASVRSTPKSRYRQWMTHKLATWIDQFGVSGCVGCGRCITWCPVGIDITKEARIIRESGIEAGIAVEGGG